MEHESIGPWLDELASAAPAPGGGAAAALEAAMAAALVEMVCNLTIGKPAHAEHEARMTSALERARTLRGQAIALVAEDAAAFRAVIDAYRLPRESEAQSAERSARIQQALAGAAEAPRRTAAVAVEILALAASILEGANPNVVSDVAAAAAAARAALDTALVNIEINRASIGDDELRRSLAETVHELELERDHAAAIIVAVRRRVVA